MIWRSLESSLSFFIFWMCCFNFSLEMLSDSNELINFQNPELLLFCFSLEKEVKIGEWSLVIAGIMSVSNINSWILLEMKKLSKRLWRNPDTCFCRKVYCFALGFLIFQISVKLYVSFSSNIFPTERF